ncbi:MAG: hypothetical protein JXQ83_13600, partial [Candidatus Glassbacteria bacterium]|nr:hypothetical protein [Candidatus Glassbacteria bacterium]
MQRSGSSLKPVLLLLCALGFSAGAVRAHQRDMVNADLALAVRLGERFIDLTLHLQYKEFPSLVERRAMDADRDGWIGPQEAAAYVQEKSGRVLEAVRLTASGQPVGLQVLGEPKLEFFGAARVVPLHQDLTVELSSPLELPGPDKSLLFRLDNRLEWPYPGRIVFALSAERSLQVDSTSLDDMGQSLSREHLRSLWFACRRRSGREVEQAIAGGEDLWRLITYVRADNRPRIAVARLDTPADSEIPAAGPESSATETR